MSEEQLQGPAGQPGAPKPRQKWGITKIVLVILGVLLAGSCLTCIVGGIVLMKPGKPIPPTDFITEKTRGIVVVRADAENPALRQLMSYAADSALKHNAVKEERARQFLQGIKAQGKNPVPTLTAVGSYSGRSAKDVSAFAALVLTEMPRLYRIALSHSLRALSDEAKVEEHGGTAIVPGKAILDAISGGQAAPPRPLAAILSNSFVSINDSCLFIGKRKEDVRAGLDALAAPEPVQSSPWPFMKLYGQADSTATIYGALSNENDLLLAALVPPDSIEEVREQVSAAIFLDPRQVKSIVFSVTVMSDDDAVVRLAVTGENEEAAKQVAALVQSLVQSHLEAAQKLPLRFAVTQSEVTDSQYKAMVNVTGLRALIDAYFASLAEQQQEPAEIPANQPPGPAPGSTPEAPPEAPAQNR
ncbi:MAG TPA: hypothetical protein VM223_05620 [Planctomycetota bacterium]|nr:hypothetical protein [Planctomycetota bacterium]